MRKKVLILAGILVLSFICGVVAAPFLQETTYKLKRWTGESFSPSSTPEQITLYFVSEGDFLVPVERKIIFDQQTTNDQIKIVLRELVNGPENRDFSSPLFPEVKLRAVYTDKDTIYVDFSSAIIEEHPGGTTAELTSIYSVVNTLLENFPSYSRVQILVDGEPQNTLAGHIDIRNPFTKNEEMIKVR